MNILSATLSALHLLTLVLGLSAVVWRRAACRRLLRGAGWNDVLRADTAWGVAAALWVATGLARVFFGGRDTAFYTHNVWFLIKMTMFAAVFAIEIRPMFSLLRVRAALRRHQEPSRAVAASIQRISAIEAVLVVIMVFVAAFMARGAWMF